jgi:hypothetical protein
MSMWEMRGGSDYFETCRRNETLQAHTRGQVTGYGCRAHDTLFRVPADFEFHAGNFGNMALDTSCHHAETSGPPHLIRRKNP